MSPPAALDALTALPSHVNLTAFAIVALAALACGMLFTRLRQPAVVGYILAGVILGPSVLGLIRSRDTVELLADLGVLMLLYLVGMELSLRGFKSVWRIAIVAVCVQLAGAVLVMLGLSYLLGWSSRLATLLGFVVALSSTAVAIKMLEDLGELRSRLGQVTVAVLIAQDLAVAPLMLIVHNMGAARFGAASAVKLAVAIALLVALTWYLSRRQRIHLPFAHWVRGNLDLTAVAGLAFCFAAAALSGLVGLSPAYGAFLAGLIIGNSAERHAVLSTMQPIQSVLLMMFFVSIGLLADLAYIFAHLPEVVVVLMLVTLCKTTFNVLLLRGLGEPWTRAYFSGVLLSQVGEFSFILAAVGLSAGVIDPVHHRLVVAVTVLSLVISPFWMTSARRIERIARLGTPSGAEIFRLVYGAPAERIIAGVGWVTVRLGLHFERPRGESKLPLLGLGWRRRRKG
ncbi:MAG TPA: cation:proton antiporter [Alphaproteobacteria bacterium]|nr:cation:proton antiporter [Alphaproteobacteria bacterium]